MNLFPLLCAPKPQKSHLNWDKMVLFPNMYPIGRKV